MLSFEEKRAIFLSFTNLKEKKISNGRINFIFPESKQKGQVVGSQLHPSGNGYVSGKYLSSEVIKQNGYDVNSRGWISIKAFSHEKLIAVISEAMRSMSGSYPQGKLRDHTADSLEMKMKEIEPINGNDASNLGKAVFSMMNSWFGISLSLIDYGMSMLELMVQLDYNKK